MRGFDVSSHFPVDDDSLFHMIGREDGRGPEERLLLAVLERAIRDYIGGSAEDKADATEWLYTPVPLMQADGSRYLEPFSFPWLCQFLELDRNEMLEKLEAAVRQSRDGSLPFFLDKRFVDLSNTKGRRPRAGGKKMPGAEPVQDGNWIPQVVARRPKGAPSDRYHSSVEGHSEHVPVACSA